MRPTETSQTNLLGIGLYSPGEASRLLGIPPSTLRRWIEGYTYPLGRWAKTHKPALFVGALPRVGGRVTLTFLDLVQLRVVHALRHDAELPLQRIRTAAQEAVTLFETSHPLASVHFKTDGQRIFASDAANDAPGTRESLLELSAPPQRAIAEVLTDSLREISFATETGLANRWFPKGEAGRIVLDPAIAFGTPVLVGSGVPTHALWEQHKTVREPERLADWFRLNVAEVRSALSYERELARAA